MKLKSRVWHSHINQESKGFSLSVAPFKSHCTFSFRVMYNLTILVVLQFTFLLIYDLFIMFIDCFHTPIPKLKQERVKSSLALIIMAEVRSTRTSPSMVVTEPQTNDKLTYLSYFIVFLLLSHSPKIFF